MRSHSLICLATVLLIFATAPGCGRGGNQVTPPPPPPVTAAELAASEVHDIVQRAAESANAAVVIAVTDRAGNILALFEKTGAPATSTGNFSHTVSTRELAVALARTAAFFSNDQAPLSSRTVRFISGIHFPPGIAGTPNAALYGIENTNRGCTLSTKYIPGKAIPPSLSIDGSTTGLGIITGKVDTDDSNFEAVNPGGVPIFRDNHVVGGVGVAGAPPDVAEFMAFSGAVGGGFGPTPAAPGVVIIDGVALPFVNNSSLPAGSSPDPTGFTSGGFLNGPIASLGPVPDGYLVAATNGSPGGLSQAEVTQIISNAVATASTTRAVIRLPIGQRARMAIAVADLDGTIIGMYRMPDSTVFSIDVAATKARNMVYFNSAARSPNDLPGVPMGTAVTNRTISFGAQPLFPPGIDGTGDGPFFSLYTADEMNPCTQGLQPLGPNQSGIVFFPGSVPLYRNGTLVGGLGISGDGVEQDDFVASGGSAGFEAPTGIRADQILIHNVRLPYLKFPRNPTG